MSEESHSEDVVTKYKRLLSLARSSLEANQVTLASKDQHIATLSAALEEEKAKSFKRQAVVPDESTHLPRRILCRVDIADMIWVLIEYDDSEDMWRSFSDEQSLSDFIQRIPGIPLICPPKSLSSEESHRVEQEAKLKVDRIVEEFRRYKVRTEIARKQKESENRQALLNGATVSMSAQHNHHNDNSPDIHEGNSSNITSTNEIQNIEIQRLKTQLQEQEIKWRKSFEKLTKENDDLRNKGETVLATQWRTRYEQCQKERDDCITKLKTFTNLVDKISRSGRTLEQAFQELSHSNSNSNNGSHNNVHEPSTPNGSVDNDSDSVTSEQQQHQPITLSEAKIKYVRHMIVQYLSCPEPEVKTHIESALMAIFRLTAEERAMIENTRKLESTDTLQETINGVTSFLGMLGVPTS